VKRLLEAFRYPFAYGNAFILILGVAVMSVFSWLAVGLLLEAAFLGYYALYLRAILSASMEGENRIPAWPDWDHWGDFIQDVFSMLAPFAVSFAPLLIFRVLHDGADHLASLGYVFSSALPSGLLLSSPASTVLSILLFLLGWLYLPMAMLVWTFYGGASILNPVAVARTAWQTGPTYLLMSALIAGLVSAAWCVSLVPSPMLTTFGASMLTFTALVIAMRMLGTFYRMHRDRLGWDRSARPEPA